MVRPSRFGESDFEDERSANLPVCNLSSCQEQLQNIEIVKENYSSSPWEQGRECNAGALKAEVQLRIRNARQNPRCWLKSESPAAYVAYISNYQH
jgi:hypothetical protein